MNFVSIFHPFVYFCACVLFFQDPCGGFCFCACAHAQNTGSEHVSLRSLVVPLDQRFANYNFVEICFVLLRSVLELRER